MAVSLSGALQTLPEPLRRWLPEKPVPTQRVGVLVSGTTLGMVLLDAEGRTLLASAWQEAADRGARLRALSEFVSANECEEAPAFAVLAGGEYQFQQLEIPDVPDEELAGVARFRVRDVARVSVESTAVSACRLERDRETATSGMVFVGLAELEIVDELVEVIEEAGLQPQEVLTREAAMTRLCARLPQAEDGLALLLVERNGGVVTMGRDNRLYLPREHRYGVEQIQGQGALGSEGLALELQRSLDFYESQIGAQAVAQVRMLPTTMDTEDLAERVRQSIVAPLRVLDITEVLEISGGQAPELSDQARLILAAGAALPVALPPGASFYHPPVERFEWHSAAGLALMGGGLAALLAVASAGHYGLTLQQERGLQAERAAHESLRAEIRTMERELSDAEVKPELLRRHAELEATLEGQQRLEESLVGLDVRKLEGFSGPLLALSRQDTEGLWLTRIRLEPAVGFEFHGRTWRGRAVPAFLEGLSQEEQFQGLNFQGLDIARVDNGGALVFRLSTQPLEAEGRRESARDGLDLRSLNRDLQTGGAQ